MVELKICSENSNEKESDSKPVEYSIEDDIRPKIIKEHTYNEAFDIIGVGRAQNKIIILCALIVLLYMNEIMGISMITIAAHCDFKMDHARMGIVHACGLWGEIISSFFWVYFSGRYGRRPILIFSTTMAILFSLLSMLMQSYWSFVWFRFFVGVFTGGTLLIAQKYAAEFLTADHKPSPIRNFYISSAVPFIYSSVIAYVVLDMKWTLTIADKFVFRPWRLLIFFNLLPGIIAVLLLIHLPESPKFLLTLGKIDAAFAAIDWLCRQNHEGRSLKEFDVHQLSNMTAVSKPLACVLMEKLKKIRELFHRPHNWNFCLSCIIITGTCTMSFGMGLWYPVILNDMIFFRKDNKTQTMCDIIVNSKNITNNLNYCDDRIADTSLIEDFNYGAVGIIAYIILCRLINISSRKSTLMCLLGLGFIVGFTLIELSANNLTAIFFSFYLVFVDLSTTILKLFMVDLMPAHLSQQATQIAMTFGSVSASLATYLIGLNLQAHCTRMFIVFAQISLVCALISQLITKEPTKQKNCKNCTVCKH